MPWDDERPVPGPLYESYSGPESGFHRFSARALGTDNVFLLGAKDDRDLRRTVQEALSILQGLEEKLSRFLPESDVSLANALAAGRPVRVGTEFLHLIERSREAWDITDGAFDPTVGPLMEAWGLVDMEGRVPGAAEIERLLECRGMDHVHVNREAGTVSYDRPGVSIDLGGIGKGYIVDQLAAFFRERGIAAGAVISGRSTVLTWGTPPGEERWRVCVVRPDDPREDLELLQAEPGAVSSSGAYERSFRRGTEVYGHVLDPRSGRPVKCILGATVWSPCAILGDVVSTTLFVLGDEAAREGGCIERLVEAWTAEGEESRCSLIWVRPEPSLWGGVDVETRYLGRPGFRRVDEA